MSRTDQSRNAYNKVGKTMMIDAHAHACGELHSIDGILKYLADNQLSKVVLCPGEPGNTKDRAVPMISNVIRSSGLGYGFNRVIRLVTRLSGVAKHIDAQNEAVARLARAHPDKIMQAYWVNPLEHNCVEKLETNYQRHSFHIVKAHQCRHDFDISHENVARVVQCALKRRVPMFIHLLSREQSVKFAALTNKYPDAAFIVGHMIGFEEITANSESNNVYFDISAPFLIPDETLKKAIRTVGSGRLILGSDTPYGKNNIGINVRRVKGSGLDAGEQENIFANNFIKLTSMK